MLSFHRQLALIPLAVALSIGDAASAGVIATGAMTINGASPVVACSAVNVGKKLIEVQMDGVDDQGNVAFSSSTFTLEPGTSAAQTHAVDGRYFCRFTFKGSVRNVRGSIEARETGGGTVALDAAR